MDLDMSGAAPVVTDWWQPHDHPRDDGTVLRHVHPEGGSVGVSINIALSAQTSGETTPLELMLLLGHIETWFGALGHERALFDEELPEGEDGPDPLRLLPVYAQSYGRQVILQAFRATIGEILAQAGWFRAPSLLPVVGSSNVAAFGWVVEDEEPSVGDIGTLYVLFTNGGFYSYANVEGEVWGAFQEAESKGGFFQREIRNGSYEYVELEGIERPLVFRETAADVE